MNQQPTVIWELTRACELDCRHCPNPSNRSRSPHELSTYEAYCLVNQVVRLAPGRFVISGGDPLTRDDVYQLVEHASRRGLSPAVALSPTGNVNADAIARLKRNGVARIIVSLEGPSPDRHDASCGVAGSYARTLHIVGTALAEGIDVEVNTLLTHENLPLLDAMYDRVEQLGAVAWNVYLPVDQPGLEHLNFVEGLHVQTVVERLRTRGLVEIRVMDPDSPMVFITSEGHVRESEIGSAISGDIRRASLTRIVRSH